MYLLKASQFEWFYAPLSVAGVGCVLKIHRFERVEWRIH
jgi:hypothetical protein